ncbi:MAG TPA: iron ABC transporter permease, partial [Pirellulales bacterium]
SSLASATGSSTPGPAPRRRPVVESLAALGIAWLIAVWIGVCLGPANLSAERTFWAILGQGDAAAETIVWQLRLPRAALATLVGAGLGAAGAAYQGVFRNPLADSFILGAASGAGVGAALVIVLGWTASFGALGAVPLGAFFGALAAGGLVYLAAAGRVSAGALILAGAAVGSILNGLLWLLLAFADQDLHRIVGWLMGGVGGRGWNEVREIAPFLLAGVLLLQLAARPLDALCCGEDAAQALGVPVALAVGLILVGGGLATGAATAAGGIIGFVGLAAPHLARPFVGPGHARLLPASALVGAVLLTTADVISRVAVAPLELPVGVVTSLLGGPVFLLVLRRRLGGAWTV